MHRNARVESKRALVIHRHQRTRQDLARRLDDLFWTTYQAENGEGGLVLMDRVRPNLIFLGVDHDSKTNWEFFQQVRCATDSPMILLTADQPDDISKSLIQAGRVAVEVPPYSIDRLVDAARSLCVFPSAAQAVTDSRSMVDIQILRELHILKPHHILAIEHALQEVGDYGEVHLVVHRGHLRFLAKLRTENFDEAVKPTLTG